ncbi:MAG TPA: type IV pilus biogenesis/stability protein PilW [Rhodocyclaceae bacterium]|nr:type IV pilus biogenesis/stability protein PilW [Rhodocyclaceae bacterium]
MKRLLGVGALVALLGGCAVPAGPAPSGSYVAQRPQSQAPVTTDARRKARVHVELGQAYLEAGRYGVALDEAKMAAAYDPGYAPTFQLMGLVHMFLEENDVAAANFEHALRLVPGDPEIANSYGWFLCSMGKEKAGIEQLAGAARNPYYQTPTRAFTNMGLCYLRLKDDGAAEQQFIRALEADNGNRQALFQLAAIQYRRANYAGAKRVIVDLHEAGEPTPESLWLAIRIEHRLGDRTAEASLVQQLRRRFPASPEYQAFLQGQYQ